MNYAYEEDYRGYDQSLMVADAAASERAAFMRRTYAHLAGAILGFVAVQAVILNIPGIDSLMMKFFGMGMIAFLILLGGFMVASFIAEHWARSSTSVNTQYAGLTLYVLAEGLIFAPFIWACNTLPVFANQHVIAKAAILTLGMFGGLTVATLITRKDFSFLGGILSIGGMVAFGLILAAIIFGFSLGLWFSFAMVGFASAAILYQTSQIQHHYRTDQHVAAALGLFAAVALLFWYILQILMRLAARE